MIAVLAKNRNVECSKWGFSEPGEADAEGIVALGGDFSTARIIAAYRNGIFPWCGDPIRWHSPDPRSIFWQVRLPRKLSKILRKNEFRLTFDRDFSAVISGCREHHRVAGEWITDSFVEAYEALHQQGYAHSVEVWQGHRLVGGLYGVHLGGLFSGESMFYDLPDASKVAFSGLAYFLEAIGVGLFDCQVINEHTHRLGAALVRRADYLKMLDVSQHYRNPFEGVRWPDYGCPELYGTPISAALAADPESANLDFAAQAQRLKEATAGPKFWKISRGGGAHV